MQRFWRPLQRFCRGADSNYAGTAPASRWLWQLAAHVKDTSQQTRLGGSRRLMAKVSWAAKSNFRGARRPCRFNLSLVSSPASPRYSKRLPHTPAPSSVLSSQAAARGLGSPRALGCCMRVTYPPLTSLGKGDRKKSVHGSPV